MSVKKFHEVYPGNHTSILQPNEDPGRYYFFSEISGNLKQYASDQEFKRSRLLEGEGSSLSGCIERNGHMGKIFMTPFQVSIKGLDTDLDFMHTFKTQEWD